MLSHIVIIWSFDCASIQLICQVAGGGVLLRGLGGGLPQRYHGLLLPCCGFPVRFVFISLLTSFWIMFQAGGLLYLWLLHWRDCFPPRMDQVISHSPWKYNLPPYSRDFVVSPVSRHCRLSMGPVAINSAKHKSRQFFRSELGRGPNIPLLSDVCGRLASR